jgi:hypothetical protein
VWSKYWHIEGELTSLGRKSKFIMPHVFFKGVSMIKIKFLGQNKKFFVVGGELTSLGWRGGQCSGFVRFFTDPDPQVPYPDFTCPDPDPTCRDPCG